MGKTILIALVVAIVVGGGAGYVGYRYGDTAGFARANQVRQQFAASRQSAQTGQGGGTTGTGGGTRAAFELQGVVKSIDANTLTVTVGQRDVTVTLTDKTQFLKSVSGGRTDLTAGVRVMVAPEGGAGAGGSGGSGTGSATAAINAASVTVLPAQ